MSSTALVGLAGGAYAIGISVYDYEWSAVVILVFFCMFLLPSIIRSQTYTMPEFLQRRYDRRVRLHFALLTLFLNIFVDSAGVLYSGSLVCQLLFPGWPLWMIVDPAGGNGGLVYHLGRSAIGDLHRGSPSGGADGGRPDDIDRRLQPRRRLARRHEGRRAAALCRSSGRSAIRACRGPDCCWGFPCWDFIIGARTNRSCSACCPPRTSIMPAGARCSPGF